MNGHETGRDDEPLDDMARELGRAMERVGGLIATAESCTGGLIARALTETAGSSAWFDRGFVTYTDESKVDLIGVRLATLAAHGAVSEAVAREMAQGALRHSRAALALAVTGIAGPVGATAGKPVGTVCFGWALMAPGGDEPVLAVETRRFDGDRRAVRAQAAAYSLAGGLQRLRRELRDRPPVG